MRIFTYLMEHKLAFVAVVLCFVIQACCELALPRYTSDIVDVGIQQSGIENPSPEVLSQSTYGLVTMIAPSEDETLIESRYSFDEARGCYVLQAVSNEERQALDKAIALPLVCAHYGAALGQIDLQQLLAAYQSGAVTKEQISQGVTQAMAVMGSLNDDLLAQQAVEASKAEYEACGVSLADMQMGYLMRVGLIMAFLAFMACFIHCIMNWFATRTSAQIGRDLRSRFFKRVVEFSDAEVDRFSTASLVTRGTNDVQQIQNVSLMAQRMVIYTVVISIGAIIMVAQTNVSMSWIIGLAIAVIFVAICILFAITMPKFKLVQKLVDKVNQVSREILTGLPVIRAFNREEFELERFQKANESLTATMLFTQRAMAFMMPVMMLVMNLVSVAIVWVGSHYVDLGTVQTGDLIAFITYSMIIVVSFLMVGMIAVILPRANVAAARIDEVINTSSSIQDALEVFDEDLATDKGAQICFNDVCFRYCEDSENVLDHVSFTAEAGKTTAIIGSTGCGKSTIIRLIERFYDVNEGSVTIDGIDVRQLSQKALRRTFGYVPQKAFLFSGTIESNVAYGMDEESDERVEQALEIAQASQFVAEKPEGVNEPIAQGGGNVSGGQRQRLAIARALATDARAYLFDDSFSALDYKTDARLRQELQTRLADKTVVIVAQRISTIMSADRIVVIDDGRVVGQGTHQQLMEGCEAYREIAYSQLSAAELAKGGVA